MRVRTESLLFRAFVLASLLFVACVFALSQNTGTAPAQQEENDPPRLPELHLPKSFGAKLLDDPTAFFTAALALLTLVLAGTGAVQAYFLRRTDESTRRSADAAQKAADVARDTLIASNRAWLRVTARSISDFLITEQAAYLDVALTFENIGNSTAQNIQCSAWLLGDTINNADPISGISAMTKHKQLCRTARERMSSRGFTLFPGERYPGLENSAIYAVAAVISRGDMNDIAFPHVESGRMTVQLHVGGVVNYNFPTDTETHQTSFLFELGYKGIPAGFDIGQRVYAGEDISLVELAQGDGRQAD